VFSSFFILLFIALESIGSLPCGGLYVYGTADTSNELVPTFD
jgi:hypothetical protein